MRLPHSIFLLLIAMAGCSQGSTLTGRYPHAAIYRTIAPWDGPAIAIILSERPLEEHKPAPPYVSLQIYGRGSSNHMRLEGKESRAGSARHIGEGGKATPLTWAEIDFDPIRDGVPVTISFELAFPDGKRERGRVQAVWWKAEGPGG